MSKRGVNMSLSRRVTAEFLGTLLLVAAVIGDGKTARAKGKPKLMPGVGEPGIIYGQ